MGSFLPVAQRLAERGVSVHWLRPREKAPVEARWSTAPFQTPDDLRAGYRDGYNLGIRPGEHSQAANGFLHLIDLDIRDPAQTGDALNALRAMWPAFETAPFVVSGSGGDSRHFYLFTDEPFRSRKLAHSAGFKMVPDARLGRDVKRWDWEIELFGTGKQVAAPPSIHPDTGKPYRWGREIDWDLLDLGVGPIVPASQIESWGARADSASSEDDDLMTMLRSEPMGLTKQEIDDTLADLPPEWVEDRDTWVQVGAALHHEYGGTNAGFERWCEWSRTSLKYDARTTAQVWKSFGKDHIKQPVRMASLIKAAGDYRLAQIHDDVLGDDLDDLDDLLGPKGVTSADTPAASNDLADLLGPPRGSIAPGASGQTSLEYDPEWKSHLQRNDDGVLKPGLHNVRLIVRNDPRLRGVIALNRFTQEIVLRKEPRRHKLAKESPKPIVQLDGTIWNLRDTVNGDLWTDSHDIAVRAVLEAPERQGGYALQIPDRNLMGGVNLAAQENGFHPIKDYLSSLRWDGVTRAERLFIDYVGSPDDEYHREAARLWLIGAVTRIFEPGHKFDFVPILEGLQGKRKSTFFMTLARNWYAELEGDFHDKKAMVEQMQGAWIIEMPELQGFSKAEVTTIKGFVSRQRDKVRLSYERRAAEFPRQCVFGGTTNEEEYLRDATGGRRFWPIRCMVDDIDIDRLAKNLNQIWGEAVDMYLRMRAEQSVGTLPLYMTGAEAKRIAQGMQESRRQIGDDEVLASRIEHWLNQPIGSELGDLEELEGVEPEYRNEVCGIQVWVEMMQRDVNAYSGREQQLMGRALRKLNGWSQGGKKQIGDYGQQRYFVRV